MWCWHKETHRDQWNRIEFRSKPIHLQPIDFLAIMPILFNREKTAFSAEWCTRLTKNEVGSILIPCVKIPSKWKSDLNAKDNNIKLRKKI